MFGFFSQSFGAGSRPTALAPISITELSLPGGGLLTASRTVYGISLSVVATNFNGSPSSGSYISVNGTTVASDGSIGIGLLMTRGHALVVLNPYNGTVVNSAVYDTYGSGTTAFQSALSSVPTGYVIVAGSYDATGVTAGIRSVLTNNYAATLPDTWGGSRISHVIIGSKR